MPVLSLSLLALLACSGSTDDPADSGADSGDSGDSGGDSGDSGADSGDSGGDSGADSGDSGDSGGDSGDSGAGGAVTGVAWHLNDTVGSVVHVTWEQSADATTHLEFGLDGEPWMASPEVVRAAGAQEELILGVPFDADVTFRVVADFGAGAVATADTVATTGPLPEDVPVPTLHTAVPEAWVATDRFLAAGVSIGDAGFESDGFWTLILDRQGRVVWAMETPDGHRTMFLQPAQDGRALLRDEITFWTDFDRGAASVVHRTRLDGTVEESIPTPGMHHTFVELPDGTIAWGGLDGSREVVRELSADRSTTTELFDCTAFWRAHGSEEQCDGNGMFYNAGDDTIYFSSDVGNTVVEIDRTSHEVLRWFGQLDGAYAFADESTVFWKQHFPTRTPDGHFMVSTWTTESNHEMVAREFAIDDDGHELAQVWSCGAGSGTEAPFMGGAMRLANGNTLLNYGGGGAFREYTADCTVVWHIDWANQNSLGRAFFLDDLYPFAR